MTKAKTVPVEKYNALAARYAALTIKLSERGKRVEASREVRWKELHELEKTKTENTRLRRAVKRFKVEPDVAIAHEESITKLARDLCVAEGEVAAYKAQFDEAWTESIKAQNLSYDLLADVRDFLKTGKLNARLTARCGNLDPLR